jgi:ubiquinone biosynthesis accessory factor UbiJ
MSLETPRPATPLPFAFLWQAADAAVAFVERVAPPVWLQTETQARIVLLINHVLQQEPQALERLKRQAGKRVVIAWRSFEVDWVATPAGLIDVTQQLLSAEQAAKEPDLRMTVQADSTADLFAAITQGQSPNARIEGDIQLAAEVGWISQHVRWDMAEDLSRVVGDAPAQALIQIAQGLKAALGGFAAPKPAADPRAGQD